MVLLDPQFIIGYGLGGYMFSIPGQAAQRATTEGAIMTTHAYTPRQVVIYPGEDGWFVAEVPTLPGCISQGRTRADAIANIREAIALMIEALVARGEPVPDDSLDRQLVVI